jgi:FlaA1/EpsC-like NDP-sugar epimerase
MPTRSIKLYTIALLLGDFATLLVAFVLAYIVRVQLDSRPLLNTVYAIDFLIMSLSIIPLWIMVFGLLGLYRSTVYNRRLAEFGRLFIGSVIGILLMLGYAFVIDRPVFPARLVAVYTFLASFVLLVLTRELLRELRTQLYRYGVGIRRTLVIGTSGAVADIAANLDDTSRSGYKIVAIAAPRLS